MTDPKLIELFLARSEEAVPALTARRSEERRVGKECGS